MISKSVNSIDSQNPQHNTYALTTADVDLTDGLSEVEALFLSQPPLLHSTIQLPQTTWPATTETFPLFIIQDATQANRSSSSLLIPAAPNSSPTHSCTRHNTIRFPVLHMR